MKTKLFSIILLVVIGLNLKAQTPDLLWAKQMGGIGTERGSSIAIDVHGNNYTSGHFNGTVDFDPGIGVYNMTATGNNASYLDGYVCKLDPLGNFLWAKQISGNNYLEIRSIALDANGNVYITGSFKDTADFDPSIGIYNLISTDFNDGDIFISKLDASGNFLWAKQINRKDSLSGENSYSLAVDANGNVFITGSFWGTVDFDPGIGTYNLTSLGQTDIFICKLDTYGNFIWAKQMGGTAGDVATSIALDANGNIYTTGSFHGTADFDPGVGTYNLTSTGSTDIFISKLDASGNFLWAKQINEPTDFDNGRCIAIDNKGNVYTTGEFNGTADFDPGIGTYNLTSLGQTDIFISKLDSTGNFIWAKQMGGTKYDIGNSVAFDANRNVYITGYFEDTADFDPGMGIYNLINDGITNNFISKLDSSGNFAWAIPFGANNYNRLDHPFAVDFIGNVYTTGRFTGTVDFDPSIGTYYLTSINSYDIYVVKFSNLTTGIKENIFENEINVYPNPFSSTATIEIKGNSKAEKMSLLIYNLLGQEVESVKNISENKITIDRSGLINGIYFYKFVSENAILATGKIIVQ